MHVSGAESRQALAEFVSASLQEGAALSEILDGLLVAAEEMGLPATEALDIIEGVAQAAQKASVAAIQLWYDAAQAATGVAFGSTMLQFRVRNALARPIHSVSITVIQPLTGEVIDCPSINVLNKDGTKSTEVIMVLAQIGRHIVREGFIRVRPLAGAVQHFRFDEPVLMTAESATAARTQIHSISQTIQTHGGGVVSADGLAAAPSSARAEQWLPVRLVPCTSDDVEQARARVARTVPPTDLPVVREWKAPAAPTGLTAIAHSSTVVLLQWVDNASNEDGVTIERCDDGQTFAPCVTLGRDTVSHLVEGLRPGGAVAFRVRCFNETGVSDYSNVASTLMPQAQAQAELAQRRSPITTEANKNEQYRVFFQELIDGLSERAFTDARTARPENYCQFSFNDSRDFNYKAQFTSDGAGVSLSIEPSGTNVADRVEKCKAYFRALNLQRLDIEHELGVALSWEERTGQVTSQIAILRDGSIDWDAQRLTELRYWMIEQLIRFREVFSAITPAVLADDTTVRTGIAHRVPDVADVSIVGRVPTRQDELAAAIRRHFPDAVVKTNNTLPYVNIHVPSVHPQYGTHLSFNTSQPWTVFNFFSPDASFIAGIVATTPGVKGDSRWLRPAGYARFNTVPEATAAAVDFLHLIRAHYSSSADGQHTQPLREGGPTRQDELAAAIRAQYPDVVCKKINRDHWLDLHLPSVHQSPGTWLAFNTCKAQIRFLFYVRSRDFVTRVATTTPDIEGVSNGLRPAGNPGYASVAEAVAAAMEFLQRIESCQGRSP